jgi:hypothetical protein
MAAAAMAAAAIFLPFHKIFKEVCVSGIIRFVQSIMLFAIGLALTGTLLKATGIVAREAVRAHRRGGVSFRWWNEQLQGKHRQLRHGMHVPSNKTTQSATE